MTRCAERIRVFVQSCAHFSETEKSEILSEHTELLADLDYYGRKLEFRRLEVWLASDDK